MSNNNEKNWVYDILDNASRTVRSWPDWMRRPEVRGATDTNTETKDTHDTGTGAASMKR